jgi:HEAT repeat protein
MMVRRQALSSLGMYGRDAAPFVDAIVRQVGDPDEKTGFTAAWALAQVGLPAQPAMQELLKSSEAVIRQRGAYALGEARVADAAPALERLAATDPSNDVREMALWASENMSQRGPVAGNVIFLAEGTDSPDPSVRLEAYQRLGIMAPGNRFVIPILVRGISDSVPAVSNAAVEGLANAGPLGASALTAVLVTDRDRSARWASILGLSRRRTGF